MLPDPELYEFGECQSCYQHYDWLYRGCIDETTKHIIEVTNNATTKMLEKAYTIRNLDNNLSALGASRCHVFLVLLPGGQFVYHAAVCAWY